MTPPATDAADPAGVPPLVRQLLANRGLTDPADAAAFLDPKFCDLIDPEKLPGCSEAAGLALEIVRVGRKIVVYGDYDVDGITGTSILWHAIRLAGGDVDYYVPHRLDEGYGLNSDALRQLAADGAAMVITVDCGITAVEQADVARDLGLQLVITDHHEPPTDGSLPRAAAIVHPRIGGSGYANANLCGAGVALKLAWAIGQQLARTPRVNAEFKKFLVQGVTLAALGTIADIVPLTGENRIITTFGLRSIKQAGLPGLDALIDAADLRGERIDAYHVGFSLAPRLNAAGRMDAAAQAVELFTTADAARASQIAEDLETHNRRRQATERSILRQAIEMLGGPEGAAARHAIVLANEQWHPGVVGIVASRLVDRFCRPTVLIGVQNGIGQGSARSIPVPADRFSIHEALAACGELLVSHGGHAMAGGVRVQRDRIDAFAEAFEAHARERLTDEDLVPTLAVEAIVTTGDLQLDVIRQVNALAPFGRDNPQPVLAAEGCTLANPPRRVGREGTHLQFHVQLDGRVFKAIAFGGADWEKPLQAARSFDVAFEPSLNTWQNRTSVELTVRDIHFH